MQVRQAMSPEPAVCTPTTGLQEVAQMMVEHDCGAIPVVESQDNRKPVGLVTDRDIACRAVAQGRNPLEMKAGDCMSTPVVTVGSETSLEDCSQLMEEKQVQRVVVVDEAGACRGIVAQADVAAHASEERTGNVVRSISEPTSAASAAPY